MPLIGERERLGSPEKVSLAEANPKVAENVEFVLRLDSLGDEHGAGVGREGDERGGEGSAHRVGVDVSDEGEIELDEVGGESQDVVEAGEARTGVVDGDSCSEVAELAERVAQSAVDRKAGVIGVLTLWDNEADMKASDAAASQVRENAVKAIGGRVVDVQVYEQVVQEMAAPPAPGSPLLITPIKMDPAKVDENIEFFKATVLPEMKATPGFRAVRNMINRQTGEGMVGLVLSDDASVKDAEARADARRARASQQGVELGERSRREILFAALN